MELKKDLVLKQAFIPLAALPGVLPGLDETHVGFLEKRDGV